MTVSSISYRRSGSGETQLAANSPLEFKRRGLGKTGQPVIRSFLASEITRTHQTKRSPCLGLFHPPRLLLSVGIALFVFGPKKLPGLGRGIGDGSRGFRSAMKEHRDSWRPKKLS